MPEPHVVICVVDNEAVVRTALARLLRSVGFTTETFAEACTCLILDVDVPGQSGRELAHSLTVAQSHVPIIVLTAREPSAADAGPSRVVAWLTKPVEADDLFAAVREALTRAGNASASRQP
jgi:FixJ family two-component response regulator